jgi:hypothetical protein
MTLKAIHSFFCEKYFYVENYEFGRLHHWINYIPFLFNIIHDGFCGFMVQKK